MPIAIPLGVTILTNLHSQSSDGIVSQYKLISDGDMKWSKVLGACGRPVLLTLCLLALHEVSYHHYSGHPLLPHHPPEINQGGG